MEKLGKVVGIVVVAVVSYYVGKTVAYTDAAIKITKAVLNQENEKGGREV